MKDPAGKPVLVCVSSIDGGGASYVHSRIRPHVPPVRRRADCIPVGPTKSSYSYTKSSALAIPSPSLPSIRKSIGVPFDGWNGPYREASDGGRLSQAPSAARRTAPQSSSIRPLVPPGKH